MENWKSHGVTYLGSLLHLFALMDSTTWRSLMRKTLCMNIAHMNHDMHELAEYVGHRYDIALAITLRRDSRVGVHSNAQGFEL